MIQAIRLFLLVRIQEFFMLLLICHTARSYLRIKAFSPYNPYGVFWRLQRDKLLHPREKYQTVETKFSNKRGRGVYCLIARSALKPWNSSKEIISLYELIMCKSYILPDSLNTSASSILCWQSHHLNISPFYCLFNSVVGYLLKMIDTNWRNFYMCHMCNAAKPPCANNSRGFTTTKTVITRWSVVELTHAIVKLFS